MSLINDALKRAKQAQQRNSSPTASAPPLRPVELARRTASGPGFLLPVGIAAFVLLGAGLLMWFALGNGGPNRAANPVNRQPESTAAVAAPANTDAAKAGPKGSLAVALTPKPLVALPAAKPAPVPTTTEPESRQQGLPTAVAPSGVPVASASAPATNVSGVSIDPISATPALPKLQGIFYRPDRPSALLNGKTILVGGRRGDFLVVAITQQSVTVVRAGQTNILQLAE